MQKQIQKDTHTEEVDDFTPVDTEANTQKGEDLRQEMDELLDEIDDVLEQNAEAMVKQYVQGGGE